MSDTELQLALAKLLPSELENLTIAKHFVPKIVWRKSILVDNSVLDTEWLHVCWLIEQSMTDDEFETYCNKLEYTGLRSLNIIKSSWQQRATAILKVKGQP